VASKIDSSRDTSQTRVSTGPYLWREYAKKRRVPRCSSLQNRKTANLIKLVKIMFLLLNNGMGKKF